MLAKQTCILSDGNSGMLVNWIKGLMSQADYTDLGPLLMLKFHIITAWYQSQEPDSTTHRACSHTQCALYTMCAWVHGQLCAGSPAHSLCGFCPDTPLHNQTPHVALYRITLPQVLICLPNLCPVLIKCHINRILHGFSHSACYLGLIYTAACVEKTCSSCFCGMAGKFQLGLLWIKLL